MRMFLCAALCGGMALSVADATAQAVEDGDVHGVIALGVGAVPEFDGAGDLSAIPFVFGEAVWRDINFEFRGLGGRVDLARDSRLSIGPAIGGRLSRDDAGGRIGRLPDIDAAIEAGGYVGYRFGGAVSGQGSLYTEISLMSDVSGVHDGALATASIRYAALRSRDFSLALDAQATWASSDYTRTYFGIDTAGAEASGLQPYDPGSGLRDVGLGVTGGYWLTDRVGLIGRIGAAYLMGDVADSPIVEEGERWQPVSGVALSYRF